jgi:hypothetical protein
MKNYYGFDRLESNGRHAVFKDALTASLALEDLVVFSNFGVSFLKWSPPLPDPQPEKAPPPVVPKEKAVTDDSTKQEDASIADVKEAEGTESQSAAEKTETKAEAKQESTPAVSPHETTPPLKSDQKCIFIRGIPSSRDLCRSESDKSLVWGRSGIIAGLVNFFSRYKGFVKIAFMVNAVVLVDFADAESAANALVRYDFNGNHLIRRL